MKSLQQFILDGNFNGNNEQNSGLVRTSVHHYVCVRFRGSRPWGPIHTGCGMQRKQIGPVDVNGGVHTTRKQHQRKNVPICTRALCPASCVDWAWTPTGAGGGLFFATTNNFNTTLFCLTRTKGKVTWQFVYSHSAPRASRFYFYFPHTDESAHYLNCVHQKWKPDCTIRPPHLSSNGTLCQHKSISIALAAL